MDFQSVIDQLTDYGLIIEGAPLVDTGSFQRVKTTEDKGGQKSGWYRLYTWQRDNGDTVITGSYGNWKLSDDTQKISLKGIKLDPAERERLKQHRKAVQEREQIERAKAQALAASNAKRFWKRLATVGESEYLSRKRVAGHGIRYGKDGILAVPLIDFKKGLMGLQFISPDKRIDWGNVDKHFWPPGLQIKGCCHRIGPDPHDHLDKPILIGEGYATGASAYEATGFTTYVAYNAGNLLEVAQAVRGVYPRSAIVLLADDDWKTKNAKGELDNVGLKKATDAATKVRGYVVKPVFSDRKDKDTDFNDLHCGEGIGAVRKQIMGVLASHEVGNWRDRLLKTRDGTIKADIANINAVLANDDDWFGVLGFCDFSSRVMKRSAPPYPYGEPGEWSDADNTRLRIWLSEKYGFTPRTADAQDAVLVAAQSRRFHPVREYLQGLRWDKKPRAEHWLVDYLGAENTPYTRAVAKKWLISAVARVMQPGCKADTMLILEGMQGLKKSTALKVLGGEWFTDSHFTMGDKDGYQMIQGIWICEMAELDSLNKAESTRAKQFVSAPEDRYRPSYGRNAETFKRQCVFAGTTNQDAYFKDATGNRRYWPVYCTKIDVDRLRADRNQIWAEALRLYRDGQIWWAADDEKELFEEQQEARFDSDVWEDLITAWLEAATPTDHTLADVMRGALSMDPGQMKPPEQKRVAQILTRLGYVKVRKVSGKESGKQQRQYVYRLKTAKS